MTNAVLFSGNKTERIENKKERWVEQEFSKEQEVSKEQEAGKEQAKN